MMNVPDNIRSYIIVDDLIVSGRTIRRIMTAVKERLPDLECGHILLYCNTHNDGSTFYGPPIIAECLE